MFSTERVTRYTTLTHQLLSGPVLAHNIFINKKMLNSDITLLFIYFLWNSCFITCSVELYFTTKDLQQKYKKIERKQKTKWKNLCSFFVIQWLTFILTVFYLISSIIQA